MLFRIRKLLGAFLLLVLIPLHVLLAMLLAGVVLPGATAIAQFGYYLVAGLSWVPLAGVIVSWMFRPPRPA